ncbi:hypothetical protein DACRYDRAFT_103007 [Dacryopinax primogenitus]|uniref:RING-type domain-containing protein n=1 Tax=Dacryopinax primogenitus (strain DJM 731) TaxID=1858805 RepID=M5GAX9_DACPD|nr:uncharacterized protein DACRYDRAFT_103007 [Dacryopinax primogenitus]EJU06059.1 hypothetical protein DACRYDRAFT_103007 [Dacryopinax primogenitus]
MSSISVPSTPTRSTTLVESPSSPSDKLARARAALLCTPGAQRISLHSAHSSPSSSGSPHTPQSSPPSYRSTRASPTSPTSAMTKRVYPSFAAAAQGKSEADNDGDWRYRAETNAIKVTKEISPNNSNSSGDENELLPTPSLAHSRTFSEQSPDSSLSLQSHLDEEYQVSLFTTPPKRPLSRLRGSVSDPPLTRSRSYTLENSLGRIETTVEARLRAIMHENELSPTTDSPRSAGEGRTRLDNRPRLNPRFPSIGTHSPPAASCSVCGICSSVPTRFSILEPCRHLICCNCLTGSLNIVREKDMMCALCRSPVQDFKLLAPLPLALEDGPSIGTPSRKALIDSATSVMRAPAVQRGAIKDLAASRSHTSLTSTILRVDNVPWDIVPPMVEEWVGEPIIAAYTLIDRHSGKTFSHAFIEFGTADQARSVLRKLQNAVLGKGKRTMAVTVTMSSQEELMTELYPSWGGEFIGACPIVTDYTKLRDQSALPCILSHKELESLVLLLENPNPRFVKTPALPYYELIGILKKIPQEWMGCLSIEIRDHLFDLCSYAIKLLRTQVQQNYNYHPDVNNDLILELDRSIHTCAAFDSLISTTSVSFTTSTPIKEAIRLSVSDTSMPSNIRNATPVTRSSMIQRFASEFNVGGMDNGRILD